MSARSLKVSAEQANREGILAGHIRSRLPGPFDAASLSRSFNIDAARVAQIIKRHGGSTVEEPSAQHQQARRT